MRSLLLIALGLCLTGCDQNMEMQPSYREYAPAPLFRAGTLRNPPANVVARDDLERDKEVRDKPALTEDLLKRGQQRFGIFCSPCHGGAGDGDGIIVRRGMPHPTSYHDERLRGADDQYLFDVITNGHGAMYSYAARVTPHDRWAIVAYIRVLQFARHASVDDVPPDRRGDLQVGQ